MTIQNDYRRNQCIEMTVNDITVAEMKIVEMTVDVVTINLMSTNKMTQIPIKNGYRQND
jgi:hypothetical protein